MIDVLAVTGPIYLAMAAGYLCTRAGLFERADLRVFGKFVIHLALPALLFNALSQRSVAEVLNPVFVAAYALGSLGAMGIGYAWARRGGKPVSASAIIAMGMSCPNSGFIGFPLVAQVFGPVNAGIGLALAMVVENLLLLPLILAVAESGPGDGSPGSQRVAALKRSLHGLVRNPMIWGIVLGFLSSLAGLKLPGALARTVDLFAMSCAALSLFVIGGSLVGIRMAGMGHDIFVVALGKLLVHPLIVLIVAALLPPMSNELRVAVVMFAAVPMLGIYPILAQRYHHDGMAAAAQLGTTVASFFTLTSLLWVVQQGG